MLKLEKNLQHLSKQETEKLIERYYNGESVKNLIKEYKINASIGELYKLFPPEVFDNYKCEYCNISLVINRPSKTNQNRPKYERDLYCPLCGHTPFINSCKCKNCTEKEKHITEKRLAIIKTVYSQEKEQVNFYDISFENKVFLGALCRYLLKENLYEIKPYIESTYNLTPTLDLLKKLYTNLLCKNIISISPNSSLSAFNQESENFPYEFNIYYLDYFVNLDFKSNKKDLFLEILNPKYYNKNLRNEAYLLWNDIAIAECIQYLQYQLNKVNFTSNYTPGIKTYKTFEIILKDFSVSQIYGIIWKAVAEATRLQAEKGLNKKHAANIVIGNCERYAERAKINGWNLANYNRIPDLPQTILSEFFFNKVLQIGDLGFRTPPTPNI